MVVAAQPYGSQQVLQNRRKMSVAQANNLDNLQNEQTFQIIIKLCNDACFARLFVRRGISYRPPRHCSSGS